MEGKERKMRKIKKAENVIVLKTGSAFYTDEKENQIFIIYKEFRVEQLQSHI